jgi:hypothetical protein
VFPFALGEPCRIRIFIIVLVLGQGAKLQKKSVIRIAIDKKVGDSVIRVVVGAGRQAAENESRASSLALPSDSRLDEVKGGHL